MFFCFLVPVFYLVKRIAVSQNCFPDPFFLFAVSTNSFGERMNVDDVPLLHSAFLHALTCLFKNPYICITASK